MKNCKGDILLGTGCGICPKCKEIIKEFQSRIDTSWHNIDPNINPIDLSDNQLPREGEEILFKDKWNTYCGFFIWSSEYKFLVNIGPDNTDIVYNIRKWKYIK